MKVEPRDTNRHRGYVLVYIRRCEQHKTSLNNHLVAGSATCIPGWKSRLQVYLRVHNKTTIHIAMQFEMPVWQSACVPVLPVRI
jgi:hypothetical protein